MATLLWSSIFVFLIAELVFTLILVIPVGPSARNWICRKVFKWKLEDHFRTPLIGIGIGLSLAMLDCISSLNYLFEIQREDGHLHMLDREKEYKTERNLYLCGFALTLLFVIGRLLHLMEEHVILEDEYEQVKQAMVHGNNNTKLSASNGGGGR